MSDLGEERVSSPKESKSPDYGAIVGVFEKKWAEIQAKKEQDQGKPTKKEKKKWVSSTSTERKDMQEERLEREKQEREKQKRTETMQVEETTGP
jgi:hypothetical protein